MSIETSCTLSSSEADSSIIDALESAAATPVESSVGTVERSLGRSTSLPELERSSSPRSSAVGGASVVNDEPDRGSSLRGRADGRRNTSDVGNVSVRRVGAAIGVATSCVSFPNASKSAPAAPPPTFALDVSPSREPTATSLSLGRALAPGRSRAPRARRARSGSAERRPRRSRPSPLPTAASRRMQDEVHPTPAPSTRNAVKSITSIAVLRPQDELTRTHRRGIPAETGRRGAGPVRGHTRLRFALPRDRCIEPSPWPPTSSLSKSPSSSSSPA